MVTNLQSSLLQSHDVFTEYLDLLNILEEELSSVSDLTLQNGPLS
jgi:RAB6A-GEF complex partner protein 1